MNIKETLEQLDKKLDQFAEDHTAYFEFLHYKAAMWDYSWQNSLIIAMNSLVKTGTVSPAVRGKQQWKGLNRAVKPSTQWQVGPIDILAPNFARFEVENEDGTKSLIKRLIGFRLVTVFDVRDTDGPEWSTCTNRWDSFLPTGNDAEENLASLCYNLEKAGIPVAFKTADQIKREIGQAAYGYYHRVRKDITLSEDVAINSQFMTLVHEAAHALHARKGDTYTYQEGEIIAQSVAFVVCEHLGINAEEASLGYLTEWIKNDKKRFKAALVDIANISKSLITLL